MRKFLLYELAKHSFIRLGEMFIYAKMQKFDLYE